MAEDPLAPAREALDRGEYARVLRLLEPLAADHSARTPLGGSVRLLMATALMGQGQSERAADCCRDLQRCLEPGLRSQARDLLLVLEAPALRRPRDWSLTLPDLAGGATLEGLGAPRSAGRPSRPDPPAPPPPPVGPTRAPLGFAALALLVLALLLVSSLLGGCMQVRTDLHFEGPGRLQIRQSVRSASGVPTPWEKRYAAELEAGAFRSRGRGGWLELRTAVLPEAEALAALRDGLAVAARVADLPLAPPLLQLQERNWLVGVRQDLRIEIDLSGVPPLPSLDLSLRLDPLAPRSVLRAEPQPATGPPPIAGLRDPFGAPPGRAVLWPLQPGAVNRLEVRCWRWSPIGLGALLIVAVLALVLGLQGIRRQLGFGLPELPA